MISNSFISITRNGQPVIVVVSGKVILYRNAGIDLIADFTSDHPLTSDEQARAEEALIASARANFETFNLTD